MQTLHALQKKIDTAKDLKSVVATMKAMASVHIRQYQEAADSIQQYNRTVELGLQILLHLQAQNIYLERARPTGTLGMIVFGSDQGMVGQFNQVISTHTYEHVKQIEVKAEDRYVLAVGRRAAARLEQLGQVVHVGFDVPSSLDGIHVLVQDLLLEIRSLREDLYVEYLLIFYNKYLGGSRFEPEVLQLLPIDPSWLKELEHREWESRSLPIIRMDWREMFSGLIREYLYVSLFNAMAQSLASENASRLASMQAAEDNIDTRLGKLNARYRYQRQEMITEELFDIVSGFEVLRDD